MTRMLSERFGQLLHMQSKVATAPEYTYNPSEQRFLNKREPGIEPWDVNTCPRSDPVGYPNTGRSLVST